MYMINKCWNYSHLKSFLLHSPKLYRYEYIAQSHLFHHLSEDYQYLQVSDLPTMYFQKSLPRLPIPKLEDTCRRYLRSQEVILSAEEFSKTKNYVDEFRTGSGAKLQELLILQNDQNMHTSYISEPWFDMYLRDRVSLVHNYNPFFAYLPENRPGRSDPVTRASNIIISSMRFIKSLRDEVLKPEVFHLGPPPNPITYINATKLFPSYATYVSYMFKGFPLDMSQFKNLFNSTRIPMREKDRIQNFPNARHMLVMKNGNFYVFNLFDEHGMLLPPKHVYNCIDYIYNDTSPPAETPIGVLTAHNRDEWAILREKLYNTGENAEAFRLIDSAAFNLAFDDTVVEFNPDTCLKTFLSGNATNRWYDKSFSTIVSADGMAAVNFEHAWGDGVAVMRYFNEITHDLVKHNWVEDSLKFDASIHVRKLEFEIRRDVKDAVDEFMPVAEAARNCVSVEVFQDSLLGKKICKQNNLSPDAIMQLAFQMAYNFLNGKSVSTYESCSTSAFKHGRTETLRPATLETKAFCETLLKPKEEWPSYSKLKEMVLSCSNMHSKLTKEAAMGQGFDRHLFGLRKVCEAAGEALPDIYSDEAFAKLNYHVLSTSTLPSSFISIGGFAPVVKDGLGIGYRILDNEVGLVVTSYPPNNESSRFISSTEKSFKLLQEILAQK